MLLICFSFLRDLLLPSRGIVHGFYIDLFCLHFSLTHFCTLQSALEVQCFVEIFRCVF